MENPPKRHVERVLFVIGEPGTGKSTQLRSLFRDWRFGTQGEPLTARRPRDFYALSNERRIHIRLTSPQETRDKKGVPESLPVFLTKCEKRMPVDLDGSRRWNFAGALQTTASKKMDPAVPTIRDFIAYFDPERIRVVLLNPDWEGNFLARQDLLDLLVGLQKLPRTETIVTDARMSTGNGLIYSDFFDFT